MKKHITFILLVAISCIKTFAQNTKEAATNSGQIVLNAYVPESANNIPSEAKNHLENKLNQIASQYGIGGSSINPRFIITAKVVTLSKDIIGGAPQMFAQNLEITFFIGDGIENKKMANTVINAKGVGTNETKSFIDAIKKVNVNSAQLKEFVENGKAKIIDYYNSQCDAIIKEALTLEHQKKYEEAIYKLSIVPDACKSCYSKCLDTLAHIYQKKIDRDCDEKLLKAKSIWTSKQNTDGGSEIAEIISTIDPTSKCQAELASFIQSIKQKLDENEKKDWDFKMKVYNDKLEEDKRNAQLEQQRINAYQQVAVEYARNQPKTVSYNYIVW